MDDHQEYERAWWGNCLNTFSEEAKQITYAHKMGLINSPDPHYDRWPQYDLKNKSVLDIGGGPTSILLKCVNFSRAAVVDPCDYPEWTKRRYALAGITLFNEPAERFLTRESYNEVWMYNVLQHVEDPRQIILCAKQHGSLLRIFEWINIPVCLGHPHMLTKSLLDELIGCDGSVDYVDENGATGWAYYGEYEL